MNFLDIILICIVGVFALRGFFRGLVQETISLVAVVLALYLAATFQHLLIPHLELYIESKVTVSALAYVIIFFGTLIVCWLIAKTIRTMLKITLLGWVDRITGGIFGLVEGALISIVVIMGFQAFAPESEWLTESKIAPEAQHLVEAVRDYMPESLQEMLPSKGFNMPSPSDLLDSTKDALDFEQDPAQ